MKALLTLSFIPSFHGLGLLLLRVWLGGCMLALHGWSKLTDFNGTLAKMAAFPKILGIAAILAESVAAAFLIIGLASRWAALALATTMGVAFYKAHGAALTGEKSGELAFIYLAGFAALVLTGPGRFSLDAQISKKSGAV